VSELKHAESFRDLIVYQRARSVASSVFVVTKTFPKTETYSLTDQVRRSSRSIGAQIAEAWAKRRYDKSFVSKLTDADAEQQETQHWIEVSVQDGYLPKKQGDRIISELGEIGRMISSMIRKADLFCGTNIADRVREDVAEYIVTNEPD
jgi:four helix bundle protein